MLKFSFKFILLALIISPFYSFSSGEFDPDTTNHSMPFKIGFEFQENTRSCGWAIEEKFSDILKEILFSITDQNTKEVLCEVVIDEGDIEFITPPFSYNEQEKMNRALSVIQAASDLLKITPPTSLLEEALQTQQLKEKVNNNKILLSIRNGLKKSHLSPENAYRIWYEWLTSCKKTEDKIYELWEITGPKTFLTFDQIIRISGLSHENDISFEDWIRDIQNDTTIVINNNNPNFSRIKHLKIKQNNFIGFKPQVTIQCPLNYIMPLFFSLYGFSFNHPIVLNLIKNLPHMNNDERLENFFSKINSFVFLLALTLDGIANSSEDPVDLINKIDERYKMSRQCDTKGNLNFMSRRPFSHMWREIKSETDDFVDLFIRKMKGNTEFSQNFLSYLENKKSRPKFPNYGHQFIVNGDIVNLVYLLDEDYFLEEFVHSLSSNHAIESPLEKLKNLLERGILTTGMIHYLNPEKVKVLDLHNNPVSLPILEKFYEQAFEEATELSINPADIFTTYCEDTIQSIQGPYFTYLFDITKNQIYKITTTNDSLSPPWFLDHKDAMGFYKNLTSSDTEAFGEALIEIRQAGQIKLERAHEENPFLSTIDTIDKDGWTLFNFFKEFKLSEGHKDSIINYINSNY